ncbi:MAG: ATP synthase F1 subunit gamma [Verrucomicrobia bacterium]|nr:ATP synthase F1 subunit gamma [Verrucomicrobiota bacterium]
MPNTRDIRRRIKSIKNTAQITKAMQMVAASKMRKAQQQAVAGRPYAQLMNAMLASCKSGVDEHTHPLLQKRPVKRVGVLLISTDKGLCGALNTNLMREASLCDAASTSFVTVGRKGKAFIARMKRNLTADFEMKESPTLAYTKKISQFMIESFLKGEIDQIDVLCTDFISTINQKPTRHQLVPIVEIKSLRAGAEEKPRESEEKPAEVVWDWAKGQPVKPPKPEPKPAESALPSEATFEPSAAHIFGALLPHYIHFQVYQCYLEAKASEHSARMVAMKNATDNAKQIIKDLTLEYNKVRQAGITREILEISTAQMAMN